MGDIIPVSNSATPGIMLVRPSLHSPTSSNSATFKRWTTMHFNDLLNCASPPGTKGITRALRYTNADGELLYTIHSDDIAIWQTQPYYAVSRRLDLENTRKVQHGEEEVLQNEHGFGPEPMVWECVDAKFGIFEHYNPSSAAGVGAYQALPESLLSPHGQEPGAPNCQLVTLTYDSLEAMDGEAGVITPPPLPPKELINLRDRALEVLSEAGKKKHSSVYRHRADAQPETHPRMAEGADGNGAWVICVFVEGEVDEEVLTHLRGGPTNVKVGMWKGEMFMC